MSNRKQDHQGDGRGSTRRETIISLGGFLMLSGMALPPSSNAATRTSSSRTLAGTWHIRLDPDDAGIKDRWYTQKLAQTAQLPSSLSELRVGDPITTETPWTGEIVDQSFFTSADFAPYRTPGKVKVPFWLQPDTYYKGAAWYQRRISMPKSWKGKRLKLTLERPHWQTTVYYDGREIGSCDSLFTPHIYDLGVADQLDGLLSIRVDNRMIVDIGSNSHGITDHTQGNWNGIVGRVELALVDPDEIQHIELRPDARSGVVRFDGLVAGRAREAKVRAVKVSVGAATTSVEVVETDDGGRFSGELHVPDAVLWDEHAPNLLALNARVGTGPYKGVRFGFRDVASDGTQITVNGVKRFLRGTLDCCIFPLTGHPPTDVQSWRKIMSALKAHGLNYIRFHSYCPPEAAFEAMDEAGIYCQIETCWPTGTTSLGDGKPVEDWSWRETERIIAVYGNHPSFLLMAHGNEPGGEHNPEFLARYVSHFKSVDGRRLWTSGAGWPELAENQYHMTPEPRIQHWAEELKSRINAVAPETLTDYRSFISARQVPVVSHEIGEWCVYPNFGEIPKYKGYLKPKNLEIFRDTLSRQGLLSMAGAFFKATGALQVLCYKEEIESALRTPGMGGFALLGLQDFPGQGTALVGVLDSFWEEKGYISPETFRRFCGETVVLAKLTKRVFTSAETLSIDIAIAHFGNAALTDSVIRWRLETSANQAIASGELKSHTIDTGNCSDAGHVDVALSAISVASKCRLVLSVESQAGKLTENDWDIWAYPAKSITRPDTVIEAMAFDADVQQQLQAGGDVLLSLPPERIYNAEPSVKAGFSTIFWNTAWTARQAPTTMGILCDPAHAALRGFPTDSHTNWQWWYILHRAGCLRLDRLSQKCEPIVRMIDDWVTARDLGLIVEARVGKGRIIVCGFDLSASKVSDCPVGSQLRQSLLNYMSSPDFRPTSQLNASDISALLV